MVGRYAYCARGIARVAMRFHYTRGNKAAFGVYNLGILGRVHLNAYAGYLAAVYKYFAVGDVLARHGADVCVFNEQHWVSSLGELLYVVYHFPAIIHKFFII